MIDNPINNPIRKYLAEHQPSAFLLAAQLIFLILYAAYEGPGGGQALLRAFNGLVLLLVVWVVRRSPGIDWIAVPLAVLAFALSLLYLPSANPNLLVWSALLEGALYFYAAGSLIVYMMNDYHVTTDELFAVGATFTLLAWGFAFLYQVVQNWLPGSFVSSIDSEPHRTFIELLFLSFTNLSAAGLSDIVPVTAPARAIVMIEQFAGVGYVAMVVSRLIALTIERRSQKHL